MTFGEAAAQWLPRAPKLRNPKSERIRERALDHHLAPIRDKALTAITPADLVEILVPLRPETALRVYGVAKAVFEFGAVLLEPEGVNLRPPTDLAKLRALGWSPRSRRSHTPMPALDWKRAPELLADLESRPEPIARLMVFILATASRCGAARMAKRKNIDLKAKTWTVPIDGLEGRQASQRAAGRAAERRRPVRHSAGRGEYRLHRRRGRPFADHDITNFVRTLRAFIRLDRLRHRSPVHRAWHALDVPQLGRGDQAGPGTGRAGDGPCRLRSGRRRLCARSAPRTARRIDGAVGAPLPRQDGRHCADTRMKRERASAPVTPEEALKGLSTVG